MSGRETCAATGLALVLLSACGGNPSRPGDAFGGSRAAVSSASDAMAQRRAAAAAELELRLTQGDPYDDAGARRRHFWASYFLAQLHTAAADAPFLTEPSTHAERLRPIAVESIAEGPDAGRRHSHTAHLVSALDHAGRARRLLAAMDQAPSAPVDWNVPGEPTPPSHLEALGTNLSLLMATSYARLGFRREVSLALEDAPRLLEPEACLRFMDELEVRHELRPWVCEMVSTHLRDTDELLAYRFAILAIEGSERFGHGLPRERIERLENWILNGARSRFVCPLSQTGYIPGQERSPLSGIRHVEYVAVER